MAVSLRHGLRLVRVGAVCALLGAAGCAGWSGAALYADGSDALAAGNPQAAIAPLERAADLVPHASDIQNDLGVAYQAVGRSDDALRAFARALELDCDNDNAQYNLDRLRASLEDRSFGHE